MGGGYHALLLQAALAGGVGLLVFFGLLAATGANAAVNGGVLAAGSPSASRVMARSCSRPPRGTASPSASSRFARPPPIGLDYCA